MTDTNLNINDISNMSEEEFKKQLLQWVERNDVSSSLQSKLRKDLFESFNSTSLGRLIAAQHQRAHRIVLSPIVLVLNTLVAEFLYSQDCHFTLSVFSTEAPYKNTLPDFEAQRKFRFNTTELDQIFEALNISPEIKRNVAALYDASGDNWVNTSLLYSLLRIILPSAEIGQTKGTQTMTNMTAQPPKCPSKKDKDLKYFRKFSHYLDQLSDHLLHMTKSMKSLQFDKTSKTDRIASNSSEKLNRLNKSLENITEKLKDLSVSKTNDRQVHEMVQNVTGLTNEMQRCALSFEKLLELSVQTVTQPARTAEASQPNNRPDPTYSEWLMKMKASKYGQRFIASLEAYQQKMMQEESNRLRKTFEDQLAQHRLLLKLHYKQKLLEKCKCMVNAANGTERAQDLINFNDIIDEKLRALKEREANAVNQNMDALHRNDPVLKHPELNLNKRIHDLSRHKVAVINIIPQQHPQRTFSSPTSPSNQYMDPKTDNIVKVAKNRLLELESEGDQLERSFHSYLQRHQERNRLFNKDAKQIWQNYEIGKKLLSTNQLPTKIKTNSLKLVPVAVPVADVVKAHLIESKPDFDHDIDEDFAKNFENPYRMYDLALNSREYPNSVQKASQLKENEIKTDTSLPKEPESKIKQNIEIKNDVNLDSFPEIGINELNEPLKEPSQLATEQFAIEPTDQVDKLTVSVSQIKSISQLNPNNEKNLVFSETTDMLSISPEVELSLPNVVPVTSKLDDVSIKKLSEVNSQLTNVQEDALKPMEIQNLSEPLISNLKEPDTKLTIPVQSKSQFNNKPANANNPAEISSVESDVQISVANKSSTSEDFWN